MLLHWVWILLLMFFRWYVIAEYFPLCNFLSSLLFSLKIRDWIELFFGTNFILFNVASENFARLLRFDFLKNSCRWIRNLKKSNFLLRLLAHEALPTAENAAKKGKNLMIMFARCNFRLSSFWVLSKWRKRPRIFFYTLKTSKNFTLLSVRPNSSRNDDDYESAENYCLFYKFELTHWKKGRKFNIIKALHTHDVNNSKNR